MNRASAYTLLLMIAGLPGNSVVVAQAEKGTPLMDQIIRAPQHPDLNGAFLPPPSRGLGLLDKYPGQSDHPLLRPETRPEGTKLSEGRQLSEYPWSLFPVFSIAGPRNHLSYDLPPRTNRQRPSQPVTGIVQHTSPTDSVQEVWVRSLASSNIPSGDWATALVVDDSGNVIVTGQSDSTFSGYDYVTIKYSPSGTVLWQARYNGPANSGDGPNAAAVDAQGNVYVTGTSCGAPTLPDYATLKYNSSGEEEWVARFDGPAHEADVATALAVDRAGNVIVTGYSYGLGTSKDYVTIRYSPTGVQQWVARFGGSGADAPQAVATDPQGSIIVAGRSPDAGGESDYTIIKYDTLGNEQWVQKYDGPRNNADVPSDLVVDSSGNIFVTGYSLGLGSVDFATVKYGPSGQQEWVRRFDAGGGDVASALALDDSGNVYVTGSSQSGNMVSDYCTIKYSSSGSQQWVARYNFSLTNPISMAYDIALGDSGAVYVTGITNCPVSGWAYMPGDYGTVKYDCNGVQQWALLYDGPAHSWEEPAGVRVDKNGNVLVSGYSIGTGDFHGQFLDRDYATLKYSPSGIVRWLSRFKGSGTSYEYPKAIACNAAGSAFVTGSGPTIKYNSSGVIDWSSHGGKAIALDTTGYVYVAGAHADSGGHNDFYTAKFSNTGVELWSRGYDGSANSWDEVDALVVDASGSVYVTGQSFSTATSFDYCTIKYDATGNRLWIAMYDGPAHDVDIPSGIAVDSMGNVYVTGLSNDALTAQDYVTVKYSASGTQEWVARYNGPADFQDQPVGIGLDAAGNIYVTGGSGGVGTSTDIATLKYDQSGNQLWVTRYNAGSNSIDEPTALVVTPTGDVFLTGSSYAEGTDRDFITIKYDSAGNQIWAARHDGVGHSADVARALCIDAPGNVYVTGFSRGPGDYRKYLTIKYSGSGDQQWTMTYDGGGHTDFDATGIAVDAIGDVYVTGWASDYWPAPSWCTFTTIKYTQGTTAVSGQEGSFPARAMLNQNFPNPFNPSTTIMYNLRERTPVRLTVYDLLGREIATLVDERQEAGEHSVGFNASGLSSGIYLYRLRAGSYSECRKLIVLR
jgi:uncharacterized delta-60 repeat protein